ncbi:hypothetical protein BH23PAT1_BH23PAT1_1400 [soil metagenome]
MGGLASLLARIGPSLNFYGLPAVASLQFKQPLSYRTVSIYGLLAVELGPTKNKTISMIPTADHTP